MEALTEVSFIPPTSSLRLSRDRRGALGGKDWQIEVYAARATAVTTLTWQASAVPSNDLFLWQFTGQGGERVAGSGRRMTETTPSYSLTVAVNGGLIPGRGYWFYATGAVTLGGLR